MTCIELIDNKGDYWELLWANAPVPYLYNGDKYWKAWWYTPERPDDFRNYYEVPLPIFTEWWPE